jgi:hypothetical protein
MAHKLRYWRIELNPVLQIAHTFSRHSAASVIERISAGNATAPAGSFSSMREAAIRVKNRQKRCRLVSLQARVRTVDLGLRLCKKPLTESTGSAS